MPEDEKAIVAALTGLTRSLDGAGAEEWHAWLVDALERASGIRGPGIRLNEIREFLVYNYAPMAKLAAAASDPATANRFFDSFEKLYLELDPLQGRLGFAVRGLATGDPTEESCVFGHLVQADQVINKSLALVKDYAGLVLSRNWEVCHALMSTPYREKFSIKAFAGQHERAAKRYGGFPEAYSLGRLPVVCAGATAPGFDWPKTEPKPNRRGIIELYFTSNVRSGNGFNAWLWLVEEEETYRIAKLNFYVQ